MQLNKIYHGDCFELMKNIPDGSVDMILCDLPYGTTACKWDLTLPFDLLWTEYLRVSKDNTPIVLTAAQPFTSNLVMSNVKMFKHEWIWDKMGTGNPLNAKRAPLNKHESILVFCKKTPTYNPQKMVGKPYTKKRHKIIETVGVARNSTVNNDGLFYPFSIITFPKHSMIGSNAERKATSIHPTQKPVPLFEYLIRTYTNDGDIVLDNCSGSGTTAIACINSNRKFICIEKDEIFHKDSLIRLEREKYNLFNLNQ